MTKLTIGNMAKMNNVSGQTLRLYDKMNLLVPAYRNNSNGYRYYDIRQCAHLDMIQYMKAMGMKLNDIKTIFDKKDMNIIGDVLRKKYNNIDIEIAELQFQKKSLDKVLKTIYQHQYSPKNGVIFLEHIAERKIYYLETKIPYVELDMDFFEEELRKLKYIMNEEQLSPIFHLNTGSIIGKNNFKKRNFITEKLFAFVEEDLNDKTKIQTIPESYFASVYCDNYLEEKYMNKLLDYLKEHEITLIGDYYSEIVTDFPYINDSSNGMFLKLQVPISFRMP